IAPWDAFNNQPMTFSYYWGEGPGLVTLIFGPGYPLAANCTPPNYCPLNTVYQEGGAHSFQWSGVDNTGAFRSDLNTMGMLIGWSLFANNAVVTYGTKAIIS